MRLIDADALFMPDEKSDKVYIIGGRSGKMVALAMELLKKKVADAPTIEAEPVRHGRWVMTIYTTTSKRGRVISNKKFACSECGYGNGRKQTNCCPNCGAKMDGGLTNE